MLGLLGLFNHLTRVSACSFLKWNSLLSSHTARRSFATNMYKGGHPIYYLMHIIGNKKESTFLNYIKVTNEEAVKIITMNYKKKAHLQFKINMIMLVMHFIY